jgi:hypothetical protein
VSELIDATPLPEPLKEVAGEVAFNAWAAAESLAASSEVKPAAGEASVAA